MKKLALIALLGISANAIQGAACTGDGTKAINRATAIEEVPHLLQPHYIQTTPLSRVGAAILRQKKDRAWEALFAAIDQNQQEAAGIYATLLKFIDTPPRTALELEGYFAKLIRYGVPETVISDIRATFYKKVVF